jgi:N-acetylglutamate synthase-like GNAT family acetyltransferase
MTHQRRHEAPELGAMIRRMARALVRRATEGDTEALEQLAMLERELPTATSVALATMNQGEHGYSYTELARVVGTTRQAARQRAVRILVDDDTAAYYSDGASRSLDWQLANGEA